jgi:hypothetical protein
VDAEALMLKKDRDREAYIRRHFDQNWCDRHLYHFMLSSCMGAEGAAESIALLVGQANG